MARERGGQRPSRVASQRADRAASKAAAGTRNSTTAKCGDRTDASNMKGRFDRRRPTLILAARNAPHAERHGVVRTPADCARGVGATASRAAWRRGAGSGSDAENDATSNCINSATSDVAATSGTGGGNAGRPELLLAAIAAAQMKRRLELAATRKRAERHVAALPCQRPQRGLNTESGGVGRREQGKAQSARSSEDGRIARDSGGNSGRAGVQVQKQQTQQDSESCPAARQTRSPNAEQTRSDTTAAAAAATAAAQAEARLGGKGEEASSGKGEEASSGNGNEMEGQAPRFPSVALPLLATLLGSTADVASAMCVNREWRHSLTHSLRSFALLFDPHTLSWRPSFHDPSSLPLMRQWTPAALHPPLLAPLLAPLPLPPPSLRRCTHGGCASCASGSTAWCSGGRGGGEGSMGSSSSSSSVGSSGSSDYRSRWVEVLPIRFRDCPCGEHLPYPCSSAIQPGSPSSWKHALSHYPNLTSLHLPLLSTRPWSVLHKRLASTRITDRFEPHGTRYPLPCDVLYSPSDISTLFTSIGQLKCSKTLRCVQVQVALDGWSQQVMLSSPHHPNQSYEPSNTLLFHRHMEKQTLETQEREMERGVLSLLQSCPNLRALHLQGKDLHYLLSLSPSTLASFSLLTHLSLPLPGAIPPPLLHLPRLVSLSLSLCVQTDAALTTFQHQMATPALFAHLSSLSSLRLQALRTSRSSSARNASSSSSSGVISGDLFQGVEERLCSLTLLLKEALIQTPPCLLPSLWSLPCLSHLHTDLKSIASAQWSSPPPPSLPFAVPQGTNTNRSAPPDSNLPTELSVWPRMLHLPSLSQLASLSLPSLTVLPTSLSLLACLSRLDVPQVTADSEGVILSLHRLTHLECSILDLSQFMEFGPSPSCRPCSCDCRVTCACGDCQESGVSAERNSSCSSSGNSSSRGSKGEGTHCPFRHCSCLHPSQPLNARTRGLVSLVIHPNYAREQRYNHARIAHTTHAHAHCYPTLRHLELHGISSLYWLLSDRPVPPPFSLFPNLHTIICTPLVIFTDHSIERPFPSDVDLGLLPSLARISGNFKLHRADVALYPSLHTVVMSGEKHDLLTAWQPLQQLHSLHTLILSSDFDAHCPSRNIHLPSPYAHLNLRNPLLELTALHTLHLPVCVAGYWWRMRLLKGDWPPHLRCLRLLSSVSTEVPDGVLGCWELEELHLIGWPFLKALPAGLAGLSRLRVVRVSGCEEAPLLPAALVPMLKGQRWHVPFSQSMDCDW